MDNMEIREEQFIDESYNFLKVAYSTILVSKQVFRQEIENAVPVPYLASMSGNSIIVKPFGAWSELPSILKEGFELIHQAKEAKTFFDRLHKIFSLTIETEKAIICVERNLRDRYDTLLIYKKAGVDNIVA